MVYTEHHLFNECFKARKGTMNVDEKTYQECWHSLCRWIVYQYNKGKGASISNFIDLTWKFENQGDQIVLRPLVLLHDAYSKAHHISLKTKIGHPAPELLPGEEINFPLVAIRFSSGSPNVTKDVVFTCVRDLFYRLGVVIGEGREVDIGFVVGRLVAKNRKVEFIFDSAYHKRSLDISPFAVEYLQSKGADVSIGDAPQSVRESSHYGSAVEESRLDLPSQVTHRTARSRRTSSRAVTARSSHSQSPQKRHSRHHRHSPSRASTQESFGLTSEGLLADVRTHLQTHKHRRTLGAPMTPPGEPADVAAKKASLSQVRETAVQDAYERYKEQIKRREEEEEAQLSNNQLRTALKESEMEERLLKKKSANHDLQRFILLQIDEQRKRRDAERQREKQADMANMPGKVHPVEPDEGPLRQKRKEAQAHARNVLAEQVMYNNRKKLEEREYALQEERDALDRANRTLCEQLVAEEQERIRKKAEMDKSWTQQVALKDFAKKASLHGTESTHHSPGLHHSHSHHSHSHSHSHSHHHHRSDHHRHHHHSPSNSNHNNNSGNHSTQSGGVVPLPPAMHSHHLSADALSAAGGGAGGASHFHPQPPSSRHSPMKSLRPPCSPSRSRS